MDGGNPYGGVIQGNNGNFYGTTETDGSSGFGTVFQLTASGSLETLYSFSGQNDGGNPRASLVQATNSNLYGTTGTDGSGGFGTIFQLTTSGSLATLYSFKGGNDGSNPCAPLIQGTGGDLYGTTEEGANGYGTVFQITTTGTFTPLYSFTDGKDGGNPCGALIQGSNGDLYGTTESGGSGGHGTVFRLNTSGTLASSGSLTTLYAFTGGGDGGNPRAGLVEGTDGNFYGTTETDGSSGFGTVFRLTMSGSLTTLHSFSGGADGGNPYAPLILGSGGILYGATEIDGTSGFGTLFQITTSGSFTTLYSFSGGADGGNPYAGLIQGTNGNLYGTAENNGAGSHGTVFDIMPPGAFSGTMTFALLRDMATVTASYIAGFAQAGYYNGLDFFRITNLGSSGVPGGFIAQGGDPTETGTGGPGFSFNNELNPSLIFTGQGQLAMANAGDSHTSFLGSNSSQFFITQGPIRALDFGYTIFGQLIRGFDVMEQVMSVPLQSGTTVPVSPVTMDSVTVTEDNTDAILLVNAAGTTPGATVTVKATDPSGNKAVVSGSTPGLPITIVTEDDTINDPPIIIPQPAVTTMLDQNVSIPLKTLDLEFDYLTPSAQTVSNSSGASLAINGNVVNITPNHSSPLGSVTIGLDVYQPYVSVSRSDPYDLTSRYSWPRHRQTNPHFHPVFLGNHRSSQLWHLSYFRHLSQLESEQGALGLYRHDQLGRWLPSRHGHD